MKGGLCVLRSIDLGRLGERVQEGQNFGETAGPPVTKQQWDCVRLRARLVDKVDLESARCFHVRLDRVGLDGGAKLRERIVERCLLSAPVVSL